MNFSLRYDLRSASFGAPHAELYAAALDQCAWADELGFTDVRLNEHHGSEDGYLPAPIVFGAAVAGRTKRLRITISALLLPLYDPIRLAEEIAVLDLASGGRLSFLLGAGYRYEEFAAFGVDIRRRGALMEEGVEILKKAWSGEPFEYRGTTIRVTPRPLQQPHPPIILGGSSAAAARRAARIADGFVPTSADVMEVYLEELVRLGKAPAGPPAVPAAMVTHIADDVDAAWEQLGPYLLYEMNTYADWLRDGAGGVGPFRHVADVAELRSGGPYAIVTPEECVALGQKAGGVTITPMVGGLPPEIAWTSLCLFETRVLPELASAPTGAGFGTD